MRVFDVIFRINCNVYYTITYKNMIFLNTSCITFELGILKYYGLPYPNTYLHNKIRLSLFATYIVPIGFQSGRD